MAMRIRVERIYGATGVKEGQIAIETIHWLQLAIVLRAPVPPFGLAGVIGYAASASSSKSNVKSKIIWIGCTGNRLSL